MTCRELSSFLDDYLAKDLPSATLETFEFHLAACSNCRRFLDGYRESLRLGKRAFEDDQATVTPDVPQLLLAAILRARLSH